MKELDQYIRNIPDFPEPGIQFKDITPLIKEPQILKIAVKKLIAPFIDQKINAVAGMEARGFIFGSLAAWELGVSFIPLRKPNKLPFDVYLLNGENSFNKTQQMCLRMGNSGNYISTNLHDVVRGYLIDKTSDWDY